MRLTKQKIVTAVCVKHNIKPEYLDLDKFEGEYYWSGKLAALLNETCTYKRTLNSNWTLVDWQKHFGRVLAASNLPSDLNAYIESIDWSVEDV